MTKRSRQVVPKSVVTSVIQMDAGCSRNFVQTRLYQHSFEAQVNWAAVARPSSQSSNIHRSRSRSEGDAVQLPRTFE